MHSVYIIQSRKDKSLYIGYSNNLKKRIIDHNNGKTNSTKNKRPYVLIYCELFRNKSDARKREIALKKKGMQREFVLKNIKNSLIK